MWAEFKEKHKPKKKKRRLPRVVCEGPVEPSDTSSGHSPALKHTTTTTTLDDTGSQDDGHGESEQSQGQRMSGFLKLQCWGKRRINRRKKEKRKKE